MARKVLEITLKSLTIQHNGEITRQEGRNLLTVSLIYPGPGKPTITTATLQHCPARLVPAPRWTIGAPCRRQAASAEIRSSSSTGTTAPIGTCREFEASVA